VNGDVEEIIYISIVHTFTGMASLNVIALAESLSQEREERLKRAEVARKEWQSRRVAGIIASTCAFGLVCLAAFGLILHTVQEKLHGFQILSDNFLVVSFCSQLGILTLSWLLPF
jgi:hypothetical protein